MISRPHLPWALRVSGADSCEALNCLMDEWYETVIDMTITEIAAIQGIDRGQASRMARLTRRAPGLA